MSKLAIILGGARHGEVITNSLDMAIVLEATGPPKPYIPFTMVGPEPPVPIDGRHYQARIFDMQTGNPGDDHYLLPAYVLVGVGLPSAAHQLLRLMARAALNLAQGAPTERDHRIMEALRGAMVYNSEGPLPL